MGQGVEIKKIKDICDKASSNIAQNKITEIDGNYPVFGASGFVQNVDFYHRDTEYIGIVKDGSGVGRVNTYPAYSSLLGTLQYIIPKEGYALNYVAYALKSLNLAEYASGAAIPHIYFKDYGEESIPVPSREEQEKIVEELDCLSGVIEKKREQLRELDALAQSIFYQMFGDPITNEKRWEVKKLGEVCNKITDGTHDTPERLSSGVKFITGKHIRAGVIDYDNSDYVLKEIHDEIYARCNPEYGDVLYTNIGANLGTAAINIVRYEFSMKNVALLKVNKDIINGYYLQSYLNDEEVKNDIINSFSNGGAQKFLSLKMIAKISIPIPSLALQQQFADKIEAIEKQKELIKKSISETENLFNARMDYYFN